jgi:hypothetical protein
MGISWGDDGMADSVQAARDWRKNLHQKRGVDYSWVIEFAKQRHDYLEKSSEQIDAKASTILGYLGGGTGLFTLGSITAFGAGNIRSEVIWFALPSFLLAGISLLLAARVRLTKTHGYPRLESAVDHAQYFQEIPAPIVTGPETTLIEEKKERDGQVEFLGVWNEATVKTSRSVEIKGRLLDLSIKYFVAAIAALALPLAISLWLGPAKSPVPRIPLIEITSDR